MNQKEDFKSSIQINDGDILDVKNIIQKLETEIKKYRGVKSETDIYCSGKVMTLDALLSAGLLFKIYETCGNTLDAHILTRIKSSSSISEKTKRKNRSSDEKLGDIIGSSLIADRVHNFADIVTIYPSSGIQSRYNERQSNINLLKEVSEFIIGLDHEENNIASDVDDAYSKNNSELIARLNINKKDCKTIIKNCNIYLKEYKPTTRQKIPINRTLKSMCRYLIDEELKRAFDNIENNLAREIANKKSIEEQLETLQQYQEGDSEQIEYLKSVLDIQNQKIAMIKKQIELLNKDSKNQDILQSKVLLSNCIDTHRIDLLEDVEKYITDRIDLPQNDTEESSIEKKYCEYMMIVLYQIKNLEFVNYTANFKGKIYETVEHSLYAQLEEYRHAEIGGNRYRNITFDDIQKLTTNLKRLNSRLSDKLQHEILDYSMKMYLSNVIKQFTGEEPSKPDFKVKQNGYVATHLDIDLIKKIIIGESENENQLIRLRKELKLVTHHRDVESTTGTAAYGSDRQENMEAKKRNLDLLEDNLQYHIKLQKGPKPIKIKLHAKAKEILENARQTNNISEIISNYPSVKDRFSKAIMQKNDWQRQLFAVIPKYSYLQYNAENDSVDIIFLSDYENIKKYYTEINMPIKRKKVENQLEELKQNKMISDTPTKITITHNQYRYFLRNQLQELKNSILSSLSLEERLDNKDDDIDIEDK